MPSDCSSANRPWKDVDDRLKLLEILDSSERKGFSALYGEAWSHLEEDEHDAFLALQESMNSSNIKFALDLLQEQRRTSQLIAQLSQSFHDVFEGYQIQLLCRIFRRGLDLLPDELLVDICEFLCEESDALKQYGVDYNIALNRFQLVCRRFRRVALGRSRLWSAVWDEMPPARIELQVDRCAYMGMSVRIERSCSKVRRCRCEELAVIKKHCSRWTRGEIIVFCPVFVSEHDCMMQLRGLRLPAMTAVKLRLDDDDLTRSVGLTWAIPRVESLTCTIWAATAQIVKHPVQRLDLLLQEDIPLGDTLRFFESPTASSIRELFLHFSAMAYISGEIATTTSIITLGCTRVLKVAAGKYNVGAIQLLQRLEFPLVERIALQVHQDVVVLSVLLGWLKNLRKRSLKRVSVIVFAVPKHDEAFREALRSHIVESVTFSSSGVVEDLEMDVGFSSDEE